MQPWQRCALFLALILRPAPALLAQEPSRILALESAWNNAELHNDAAAVQMLLADDFVMTVAEGKLYNKAEILASVKERSYSPELLESSGMVVHPYGHTAIVTGAYHEKGVDKGKPWERRGRFTDTWLFLDGKWQCVASHFSIKPK
jgi:ketosteroid isomerase-like protein